MILFWVICAVLIVIALAFVLPPVLQHSAEERRDIDDERRFANIEIYRDQLSELKSDLQNGIVSEQQYEQDREEIERRLLEDTTARQSKTKSKPVITGDRSLAYALALALPLVAIVFYLKVGEPNAMTKAVTTAATSSAPESGERSQAQIEANVAALAKRLQTNPNDAEGWIMLARSYNSMERFGEASGAYAKATELNPKNADLWAEFAFATAMANGRTMAGRPMELIDEALKVDPENAKALQLAGSAAFEAKDYKKAIEYWQRVLSKVPPDSDVGKRITDRINEAKSLGAIK
jgi:cytochrome c-type biogenesis protein CcmH